MVLVSVPKSLRFLYNFFLDFGSILDPTGHQQIEHFVLNSGLGVALGVFLAPGGSPKRSKRVSEADFSRIVYHFGVTFL